MVSFICCALSRHYPLSGYIFFRYQKPDIFSKSGYKGNVKFYPGVTIEDITDYLRPATRKKPDLIIVHTETNNLINVNTMKYVKYFIEEMNGVADIQVGSSGMAERRNHDLSEKIKNIYERLKRFCNSFLFIDNSNVDENSVYTTVLRKKSYYT